MYSLVTLDLCNYRTQMVGAINVSSEYGSQVNDRVASMLPICSILYGLGLAAKF